MVKITLQSEARYTSFLFAVKKPIFILIYLIFSASWWSSLVRESVYSTRNVCGGGGSEVDTRQHVG